MVWHVTPLRRVGVWLALPAKKLEQLEQLILEMAKNLRNASNGTLELIKEIHRFACSYIASRYKPDLEIQKCRETLDKMALGEIRLREALNMLGIKAEWLIEAMNEARKVLMEVFGETKKK